MDALSLEQNTCHQSNFSLSLHKRGDRFTVRDTPCDCMGHSAPALGGLFRPAGLPLKERGHQWWGSGHHLEDPLHGTISFPGHCQLTASVWLRSAADRKVTLSDRARETQFSRFGASTMGMTVSVRRGGGTFSGLDWTGPNPELGCLVFDKGTR
jgi:hypothetical protein